MFRVRNTDTGEELELSIIDAKSGIDYVADFIGNTAHDFVWDSEAELWKANTETIDWWIKVLAENEALGYRLQDMVAEYGWDAVDAALAIDVDLEDYAYHANSALDQLANEAGE